MLIDCLKFPFQVEIIHKKKRALRKELLLSEGLIEKRIAILGGSTISEIRDILELFLLNAGIKPVFYESGFNRYYEDAVFENNILKEFSPDIVYIHTTNLNIGDYPLPTDTKAQVLEKFEREVRKFTSIWESIKREYHCAVIQNNFELHPDRPMGNLDFTAFQGRTNFIMKLNLAFAEYAQSQQSFYINDINYLAALSGLGQWHDSAFWYSYKYALNYDAISLLAHNIASIIKAVYGKSKKCLVLDLDNTLWGGVIGDDGADNIAIGKEGAVAEAHTAFQEYVKSLKQRGVMLAVCSKNDMANALEGFQHVDSILKIEDFAAFKANWDPKHRNIKAIAEEIGIGSDSLVFVDDNPAEREIVRAQMPEVEVPEIGSDIVKFIGVIDRQGYFEPIGLSAEDMARGEYYRQNASRQRTQETFADYGAFLASLNMKAEIRPFTLANLERITQLINKTNQFNLTTRRYNSAEFEAVVGAENTLTLYGRLSDKFGDNGIVSLIICSIYGDELGIDLWLMSCRVIKREMELAMFDTLVATALAKGVKRIAGTYIRTSKNDMVAEHYASLGFEMVSGQEHSDSRWLYEIPANYANKNRHIEVIS